MAELPPGFKAPTDEDWNGAAQMAEEAFHEALSSVAFRLTNGNANPACLHAVGFAAVVQAGRYLRAFCKPGGEHVLEQWAISYLRGALRGSDLPLRDNGKEMVKANDA